LHPDGTPSLKARLDQFPHIHSRYGGWIMKRFFFNLQGTQNIGDPLGLLYASDLEAFRVAQRLASDLSKVRHNLHGNTCVVFARKDVDDLYLISF
jgi:hypothetical protein